MKLKRLLAAALILALAASLAGCSAGLPGLFAAFAPDDAVPYSYDTLARAVDDAMLGRKAQLTLDFSAPAPGSVAMDADIRRLTEEEYLPARFTDGLSWVYSPGLFHSRLVLDIAYGADADRLDELAAGGMPDITEFSEAALEMMLTGMITAGKTRSVCLFSGESGGIGSDIDAEIDRLNNQSCLFCYYVDSVNWETLTAAGLTELTVELEYTADRIPYAQLETVSTRADAVRLIMDAWREGKRMATFIVNDPSWDHDTLFALSEAAEANSGELASECTYFNGNMYPRTGDVRIAEAWLTFPMMDLEVERRSAALSSRVDELYAELAARGISDRTELLRAIHDTVVELADYDDDIADATINETLTAEMYSDRTAYGALVTGKTVCTGYARAFKAICDRFSLPCWVMYGDADGEPHAWNAVDAGNGVRYIDCTFDDTDRTSRYFMFSDPVARQEGYTVDEGYFLPEWME